MLYIKMIQNLSTRYLESILNKNKTVGIAKKKGNGLTNTIYYKNETYKMPPEIKTGETSEPEP